MTEYEQLHAAIESRIASDPQLRALRKKISQGTATLAESSKYSQLCAQLMGQKLSGQVLGLSDREGVCTQLLRDRYSDVNQVCEQVMRSMDERAGIAMNPRHAAFPAERVQQLAHSLTDPTVPDETIQRRANTGAANVAISFHDDFVDENAAFRSDAGYECYITRVVGGASCSWCSAMAGRFRYDWEEMPEDIFRRHDNCTCTVTFEQGAFRQDVWSKRSWDAPETGAGAPPPKVFSQEEADRLEQERLSEYRGLTSGGEGGIIEARGYADDNFDRKTSLSTTDEDLKAVNPNHYTDNCQRCVPTYVLRRRGFNVEAMPTGQNPEMDNLLSNYPNVVWEKSGSPVIPKSTRGSQYYGKPEIEKFMKDLPDGAMCEVRCTWDETNEGHVFIAEKNNGAVRYVDPQTGDNDVSRYFKLMKKDMTTFWRIDDAALNDDIIKHCCMNM